MTDPLIEKLVARADELRMESGWKLPVSEAAKLAVIEEMPRKASDVKTIATYVANVCRVFGQRSAEHRKRKFDVLVARIAELIPQLRGMAGSEQAFYLAIRQAAEELQYQLPHTRPSLDRFYRKVGSALKELIGKKKGVGLPQQLELPIHA